jgi:hypothetical protein
VAALLDAGTLNHELPKLGYRHQAFISYARSRFRAPPNTTSSRVFDDRFRKRTELLKKRLEEELMATFNEPSVFSDSDIPDTAKWQETLARALYGSVVVIAICDPVYFTPEREWCAREWHGAMEEHSRRPMADDRGVLIFGTTAKPQSTIYPIWTHQYQGKDLSAMGASGWSRKSRSLSDWIANVKEHIEVVASHWIQQGTRALDKTCLPPDPWPPGLGLGTKYPLEAA